MSDLLQLLNKIVFPIIKDYPFCSAIMLIEKLCLLYQNKRIPSEKINGEIRLKLTFHS
jgi:hypothetical protein